MGLPLFRSVARGVHAVPGWKKPRFSLIHVADLVELLILAAQRGRRLPPRGRHAPSGQGCYFAGCEESPTYADLGRMVARAVGRRRVLVIPMAAPVVRTVAAVGELIGQIRRRPPYMNLDKVREMLGGHWICSTRAAEEELGFRVGAPIQERLRQTAEWYRCEKWL
jgi:nucleoside-diphosphate-sugar epimerase